jgi:dTDP-3-amino-3,4,6-trideoxy-alpha-D-glucose transaminase
MVVFNNLKPMQQSLSGEISAAVHRVLDSGWYILGKEMEAFEHEFAAYHQLKHAIGVANGTDAIELALRAAGIGPGDEVITVAHTAVATVCAVERAGATPVMVDVDPVTYTMNPDAAAAAITSRTRALLPVHIYGHPADLGALKAVAQRHNLLLIEDCAQAHGALYQGRKVGTWGDLAAFSFYPTKNLGAYGDGGAVITNDDLLAEKLRRLRNYGQTVRYHHVERGMNSRLDEMQAAILRVKLQHLDEHNAERRRLAGVYARELTGLHLPQTVGNVQHVYHLYVTRTMDRDGVRERMKSAGAEAQIHYPVPVHRQPAYRDLGYAEGSLPVTERLCREILSLPMYVGLTDDDVRRVAHACRDSQRKAA